MAISIKITEDGTRAFAVNDDTISELMSQGSDGTARSNGYRFRMFATEAGGKLYLPVDDEGNLQNEGPVLSITDDLGKEGKKVGNTSIITKEEFERYESLVLAEKNAEQPENQAGEIVQQEKEPTALSPEPSPTQQRSVLEERAVEEDELTGNSKISPEIRKKLRALVKQEPAREQGAAGMDEVTLEFVDRDTSKQKKDRRVVDLVAVLPDGQKVVVEENLRRQRMEGRNFTAKHRINGEWVDVEVYRAPGDRYFGRTVGEFEGSDHDGLIVEIGDIDRAIIESEI